METQQRTLAKTITYRLAAVLATVPFTGVVNAISIHLILALIYYVHERIWARVGWGRH